jgi:uncharacterized protein YabN with tetrapyrrole methylase and pyrophosphatase domain
VVHLLEEIGDIFWALVVLGDAQVGEVDGCLVVAEVVFDVFVFFACVCQLDY